MRWTLAGVLVLSISATLLGQPQPGGGPPGRDGPMSIRNLSPEARLEFDNWVKERMPNLHKLVSDTQRMPRRFRLLNAAYMRYRSLQQIRDDPEALERALKSIKLEDAIFGYVLELEGASPSEREQIRGKIRAATRELVDAFLAERAERLERLKARVEEEERQLEEDRRNPEQLVERRLQHFQFEPTTNENAPGANQPSEPVMAAPEQR